MLWENIKFKEGEDDGAFVCIHNAEMNDGRYKFFVLFASVKASPSPPKKDECRRSKRS